MTGTHTHVIWGVNTNIFPSPSHQLGGGEFPSLPLPPTGEHNAIGGLSGAFGTSGSISPLGWVDGTLAHILRGVNAIIFPSPLHFFYKHGGGMFPNGST